MPVTESTQAWRRLLCLITFTSIVVSCTGSPDRPSPAPAAPGSELLYVWAGDVDEQDADFLAVVDAQRGSPTYGQILKTLPVDGRGHVPHHTEYELSPSRTLFANGWGTGSTFIFDLSNALAPRVSGSFTDRGNYRYPHSYARLPNGHVLATFQSSGSGYTASGGIVELAADGSFVRAVSGTAPGIPAAEHWPYSLLVLADVDRLITTNTRMGLPAEWRSATQAARDSSHHHVNQDVKSTHVQIWRLSDLTLLHTLKLPPQGGGHESWTAEPRRLANGDVYVNTFSCGLYRIDSVAGDAPRAEPAASSSFKEPGFCAVPVIVGNFWIQPSATERTITTYDLSVAGNPRVASRLVLDEAYPTPHWLSLDPAGPRIVVTSDDAPWVLIINVDPTTGTLAVEDGFRDAGAAKPGVSFDRAEWPHGGRGRAQPHGALFGPRN